MPKRTPKKDPETYKKEEVAIKNAYQSYLQNQNQKITALAREFDAPYRRLLARIHSQKSYQDRGATNLLLSKAEESAVKAWIEQLDIIGTPPTNRMIIGCANAVLARSNPHLAPPPTVSPNWVYGFLKRLPDDYERVEQKPIDPKRLNAEDLGVLQTWFDRLQIQLNTKKITPSNIWNFDETGFRVGQGKKETVVTRFGKSRTRIASASSRESLTLIECVSASGKVIPPLIILAAKNHMEEWYQHLKEEDYLIAYSKAGYSNSELIFEWIHHFAITTKKYAGNGWRMLLMDNFDAHITYDLYELCMSKKIIVFTFPPNTTHILQPLDGVPFQNYKHFHGVEVNNQARAGGVVFDKYDFLYNLPTVRNQTFTSKIIRAGFRDRGIIPYNPEIVFEKIGAQEIIDSVPILKIWNNNEQDIPSSPTTKSMSPPLDAYRIGQHIKKIEKDLDEIKEHIKDISPNLERRVRRIMKGSLINAHLRSQNKAHIDQLLDLNGRKAKVKSRRQVLNVGGVLSVRNANTRIDARKAEEIKKKWRKEERARKQRIRQAKQIASELAQSNSLIASVDAQLHQGEQPDENPYFYLDPMPSSV
jgi:hypothetical protein